jgi:hypothetical protein
MRIGPVDQRVLFLSIDVRLVKKDFLVSFTNDTQEDEYNEQLQKEISRDRQSTERTC